MVIHLVLADSQRRIIEYQLVKVAEVVARMSLSARSTYTASVVEKLRAGRLDPGTAAAPGQSVAVQPAAALRQPQAMPAS